MVLNTRFKALEEYIESYTERVIQSHDGSCKNSGPDGRRATQSL